MWKLLQTLPDVGSEVSGVAEWGALSGNLGLSDALGLVELASPWWCAYASSSARGEREGDKRSVDRLIQSNLDSREETAMLGEFCIWGHRGAACPQS